MRWREGTNKVHFLIDLLNKLLKRIHPFHVIYVLDGRIVDGLTSATQFIIQNQFS